MGILGDSNTGKTFAWAYYKRPDEVFSISPTNKVEQLGRIAVPGFKPQEMVISYDGKSELETIQFINPAKLDPRRPAPNKADLIYHLLYTKRMEDPKLKVTGHNIMASKLTSVVMIKNFVAAYMPEKRIILTHDFSHYLNFIIAGDEFRSRKNGGDAFSRFWDLAADSLDNIFIAANNLPKHVVDVTEFHIQLDPEMEKYDIFTTAGKMLQEKFKGKSYLDISLFSTVTPFEQQSNQKERFKFVSIQKDYFDGRDMGLFHDLVDQKGEIHNYMITEIMDRIFAYL